MVLLLNDITVLGLYACLDGFRLEVGWGLAGALACIGFLFFFRLCLLRADDFLFCFLRAPLQLLSFFTSATYGVFFPFFAFY